MEKHTFYDGKSALRQDVSIQFSTIGLDVRDALGRSVSFWNFSDMQIVDEDVVDGKVRISNPRFPDARLMISGHSAIQALKGAMKVGTQPRKSLAYKMLFAIPAALALSILAFTFYGPSINPYLLHFVPVKVDHLLGTNILIDLSEELHFCQNNEAEAALQKIVYRLSNAAGSEFHFFVSVARKKDANAFALPGGHVVLLSGLLREADSPEEVAGVLAHEMAHVIARHGVASLIKQLGMSGLLLLTTGDTSRLLDFGNTLVTMKMSREQEAEADKIAADILGKAEISTAGFRSFFKRSAKNSNHDNGYEPLEFLTTHPSGRERAQALQDPPGLKKKPLLNKREFRTLKDYCKSADS